MEMSGQLHTVAALLSVKDSLSPFEYEPPWKLSITKELLSLEGIESEILPCLTCTLIITQTEI